jgi:hypothetical protein
LLLLSDKHIEVLSRRWLSSGLLRRVVWKKFTDVAEVLAASVIRAISNLHTRRCENLKSHYYRLDLFVGDVEIVPEFSGTNLLVCIDKRLEPCLRTVSVARFLANIEQCCVRDNRSSRRGFGVVSFVKFQSSAHI